MKKDLQMMKAGRAVALGLVMCLSGAVQAAVPDYTTLIAHRGESVDAPENTLPAYRTAVSRGFGFECDIYLSKDGRCFTFHDGDLKRTTAGANTNRCGDVTWETVSQLNVGGWGKWKGSAFDPTRPALLEEVLAEARPGRQIYVEVKTGPEIVPFVKKAIEAEKKATPESVLFISFNAASCAELKKALPAYKVYFLSSAHKNWSKKNPVWTAEELLAKLKETGADGLDIQFEAGTHDAAFVRKFHDAGYSFHVWTVDDLKTAKLAFAAGADTLTTNCAKRIYDESQLDR